MLGAVCFRGLSDVGNCFLVGRYRCSDVSVLEGCLM